MPEKSKKIKWSKIIFNTIVVMAIFIFFYNRCSG